MTYKPIIPKEISRALGQCGLSRHALLWTPNNLYQRLENEAERFRAARVPGKEDDCFVFEVLVRVQAQRHRLTFHVNDRIAPGSLLIEALISHS